jgi:hypothetical protein
MWKHTIDDLYELPNSNYEETVKQVKKESDKEVALAISLI